MSSNNYSDDEQMEININILIIIIEYYSFKVYTKHARKVVQTGILIMMCTLDAFRLFRSVVS